MTDQQFIRWLKDGSAIRCILMEVGVLTGGVEETRYLSDKGYVTGNGDIPANTVYSPVIAGGVKFTESISLDGSVSLSFGDVEIFNTSGNQDSWMEDIWTNRPVRIYIGDMSWPRAEFRKIFDGIVVGIDSRRRDRLNLKLSDKLQRLNTVVSEVKLGGETPNKDRLIPLCFGECHNVEPLLVDPANHVYQVHNGPIERIIEVRDNGVPVSVETDLANGKFRLLQSPVGTITCSVQGDKHESVYANDVTSLIKRLVKGFGTPSERFSDADLDLPSLEAFAASNPAPVGIYLNDRANVLEVCNRLASSIGARLTMGPSGLLSLVKIDLPRADAGTIVTASDMVQHSIHVASLPDVVAGVKLGYCKNWTVQSNLQTGLPAEHISLFAQEWLTATATDSDTATKYKMFSEPVMSETMLLTEADATSEANRRLNLFNIQRKVIKYEGFANLMLERLGESQTVVYDRFGLNNGVTGQIISKATDWWNYRVEVEVLL